MADKKKDEIVAKGQAEAAFVSFQNDPKSASRPDGFRNNFPDLKTSWDSLNEKKRKELNLSTFTIHEVGIMISQLQEHNFITTQRSLYKIDLDNAEILAENHVMRNETSRMNIMLETNARMLDTLTSKMENVLDQIAENNDAINRRIDGL